ncbi:adenylate/guanylate cyclase domain-containing protein [Verrucomicrobiota bacterium]
MKTKSSIRNNTPSNPIKDIRVIIAFVPISIIFGAAMASIIKGGVSMQAIINGGAMGFFISAFCAIGHYTFLHRLRYIPFTAHLMLSTAYYTFVAMAVLTVKIIFFRYPHENLAVWTRDLTATVFLTMALSFATAFVLMLRRMLGPNVLLSFFTGRYHTPVEEERIFMFLDLVSSTTIAEKIGNLNFHVFLNDFYYDITDAILSAKGAIYKYVGDEVIICWKTADKSNNFRCIQLFFDIIKIIESKKGKYLDRFGFIPYFRAGIHCGPVIVGEMGDYKQEISFLGDTVNTTSRIQEACKDYKTNLLVTSELLDRVDLPPDYKIRKYGETFLKGKEKPMTLFGIEEHS